ncbi:conserved Plasmodium protein, unknown function [Plasmodium malariae]|uniref:Pinin/SDK/MemA protein domain-containing protein n=1 Tax=Plasmodium malariae TaxID=5858 RepID=A0A1A8WB69_PLAMA|nr:conserved Plasmodium protein, unknown function [Plasmodium malariae]
MGKLQKSKAQAGDSGRTLGNDMSDCMYVNLPEFTVEKRPKLEDDLTTVTRNKRLLQIGLFDHLKKAKDALEQEKSNKTIQMHQMQNKRVEDKLEEERKLFEKNELEDIEKKIIAYIKDIKNLEKNIKNDEGKLVKLTLINHYDKMKNFISTNTYPTIFWRPLKYNEKTELLQKNTQDFIKKKIEAIKSTNYEIDFNDEGWMQQFSNLKEMINRKIMAHGERQAEEDEKEVEEEDKEVEDEREVEEKDKEVEDGREVKEEDKEVEDEREVKEEDKEVEDGREVKEEDKEVEDGREVKEEDKEVEDEREVEEKDKEVEDEREVEEEDKEAEAGREVEEKDKEVEDEREVEEEDKEAEAGREVEEEDKEVEDEREVVEDKEAEDESKQMKENDIINDCTLIFYDKKKNNIVQDESTCKSADSINPIPNVDEEPKHKEKENSKKNTKRKINKAAKVNLTQKEKDKGEDAEADLVTNGVEDVKDDLTDTEEEQMESKKKKKGAVRRKGRRKGKIA